MLLYHPKRPLVNHPKVGFWDKAIDFPRQAVVYYKSVNRLASRDRPSRDERLMQSLDEILKRRAAPGVLILNQEFKPVFVSAEALSFLEAMDGNAASSPETLPRIPDEVLDLCASPEKVKKGGFAAKLCRGKESYLVRVIPMNRAGAKRNQTNSHFMVIIEGYSLERKIDTERLTAKFNLTKREAQIAGAVAKGLKNTEIGELLYVSENTVKDHLKKIMGKLGVNNRASIFCKLLE